MSHPPKKQPEKEAPKKDLPKKDPQKKDTAQSSGKKASTEKSAGSRRKSASATAKVIREMDMMRAGLDAVVRSVTATQLVLEGAPGLKLQDQLKVRLHHVVQRFDKEVRGLVRQIEPIDADSERVTVELFTRLTPVEVSVLKMGIDVADDTAPRWV
jgi:hypothetical protein